MERFTAILVKGLIMRKSFLVLFAVLVLFMPGIVLAEEIPGETAEDQSWWVDKFWARKKARAFFA